MRSTDGQYEVVETDLCGCGMRRFLVTDLDSSVSVVVHDGYLTPRHPENEAVRDFLAAERLIS